MIKDKVVFITGASRGIGLATVNKFVANGWRVAGFYNQKAGLEIDTVSWFQLDVANYSSIKTAFSLAFKKFGQIDCLVNCAGIFGYKDLVGYDEELIDKIIAVNEKGTYLCVKEILDKM